MENLTGNQIEKRLDKLAGEEIVLGYGKNFGLAIIGKVEKVGSFHGNFVNYKIGPALLVLGCKVEYGYKERYTELGGYCVLIE